MSILRLVFLGTYVAGMAALLLSVVIRSGLPLATFSPRGALGFAGVCFLSTLATRKVMALVQASQAEAETKAKSAEA